MTAAPEGCEWSAARPGRTLPPGKNRYPFYRRLGGPQGWSGRAKKKQLDGCHIIGVGSESDMKPTDIFIPRSSRFRKFAGSPED